jgi:glycerol-3-phosphate acyltransferase PlsY
MAEMTSDFGFSFSNQDVVPSLAYLAIAFLIGSIPFGLIVGRLFYRSDLRQSGSGNIGAANALRSYGAAAGVIVLLLDALKGFLPVAYVLVVRHSESGFFGFGAFVALLTILGHCYSPWLGFKGGKGVATWLGALFALSWVAGLTFVVVWLIIVMPSRYASLGSIIATLLSPIVLLFVSPGLNAFFAVPIALLIVWKHRENIARLREGRENKISFGKASA